MLHSIKLLLVKYCFYEFVSTLKCEFNNVLLFTFTLEYVIMHCITLISAIIVFIRVRKFCSNKMYTNKPK